MLPENAKLQNPDQGNIFTDLSAVMAIPPQATNKSIEAIDNSFSSACPVVCYWKLPIMTIGIKVLFARWLLEIAAW